ncbi:inositol polyphosphate multikinase beta-like [Nymphaea colorata]|uniref:inositol polyphosphate multikinase beta-like n=1 Tax=Nymphaea colorata TaxID=210225 RepID=UPI00129D9A5F|nr:inositol polyphosphate multikinase beta-like [Nymphaea colorata]
MPAPSDLRISFEGSSTHRKATVFRVVCWFFAIRYLSSRQTTRRDAVPLPLCWCGQCGIFHRIGRKTGGGLFLRLYWVDIFCRTQGGKAGAGFRCYAGFLREEGSRREGDVAKSPTAPGRRSPSGRRKSRTPYRRRRPLQDHDRGSKEVGFYRSFWSNSQLPPNVHRFFPSFYGTQLLEASDGSGPREHLVIDDVVSSLYRPSVIDVKIGSRTWYPGASDEYVGKCVEKDRTSTSLKLGFRISGLQVYPSEEPGLWKPGRRWVKAILSADQVRSVLRVFVSSNASSSSPDCAHAPAVFGGPTGVLAQLLELKQWFEKQTFFHFYSKSVLLMYGQDETDGSRPVVASVKLVDFAHVVDGEGVIDHNFLGGLCSLIKFVEDILESIDGSVAWTSKLGSAAD